MRRGIDEEGRQKQKKGEDDEEDVARRPQRKEGEEVPVRTIRRAQTDRDIERETSIERTHTKPR